MHQRLNVAPQRADLGKMAQERSALTQSLSFGPGWREASSDVPFRYAGRDPHPMLMLQSAIEVPVFERSPIILRREALPAVSGRVGCVDSARG